MQRRLMQHKKSHLCVTWPGFNVVALFLMFNKDIGGVSVKFKANLKLNVDKSITESANQVYSQKLG